MMSSMPSVLLEWFSPIFQCNKTDVQSIAFMSPRWLSRRWIYWQINWTASIKVFSTLISRETLGLYIHVNILWPMNLAQFFFYTEEPFFTSSNKWIHLRASTSSAAQVKLVLLGFGHPRSCRCLCHALPKLLWSSFCGVAAHCALPQDPRVTPIWRSVSGR